MKLRVKCPHCNATYVVKPKDPRPPKKEQKDPMERVLKTLLKGPFGEPQ